eukprot:scaffold130998_cov60-Phaeocystis_antarctica.AAC.3
MLRKAVSAVLNLSWIFALSVSRARCSSFSPPRVVSAAAAALMPPTYMSGVLADCCSLDHSPGRRIEVGPCMLLDSRPWTGPLASRPRSDWNAREKSEPNSKLVLRARSGLRMTSPGLRATQGPVRSTSSTPPPVPRSTSE